MVSSAPSFSDGSTVRYSALSPYRALVSAVSWMVLQLCQTGSYDSLPDLGVSASFGGS